MNIIRLGLICSVAIVGATSESWACKDGCPAVTVSDNATITAKPDASFITFYLQESGIKSEDALDSVEKKSLEVQKILKEKYPDIVSIKSSDLGLEDPSERSYSNSGVVAAINALRRVEIIAKPDPKLANSIFKQALAQGGLFKPKRQNSYVQGDNIRFGLIDVNLYELELEKLVLKKLTEKAERVAARVNRQLSNVSKVYLNEYYINNVSYFNGTPEWYPTKLLSSSTNGIDLTRGGKIEYELKTLENEKDATSLKDS